MNISWQTPVTVVGGLSLIIGTAFAIDARYTKQPEHLRLAQAFEKYVTDSRADTLQQRLWDTEDRLREAQSKKEKELLEQRKRELQAEFDKVQKQRAEQEKK